MPRERIFGPHEGETYQQHLTRLQEASLDDFTPSSKAASLMAAMMLMQHGGRNRPIDREQFNETRRMLEGSKAFKKMMKDPQTEELVRKNDTTALIAAMAQAETARRQRMDEKYKRPEDPEVVAADAKLLKSAIDGLKESAGNAPTTGSPENERRGRLYAEMMKQLEHAQSLTEKGIQLSGESTKALIGSIKAYNDGGKQNVAPAGEKQAEGFTQSMALLKHYMPAAKFNRYCKEINESRDLQDEPFSMGYAAPESFEPACLTGGKTAKLLTNENRIRMQNDFSVDSAAEGLAIRQLSGGDPNRLISPEALEKQKAKLVEPGTAFMKVMGNEKARENIRRLAEAGVAQDAVDDMSKRMDQAQKDMQEQARKAVVRSAQGEINRSIMHLTNGAPMNRYFTEQYLANILASEQLAMNAKGGEKITNGAFRSRAEQLRQDPAFQRLADRYMNDAAYRENMNRGLLADRSAQGLAAQYQMEKQPVQARRDPEQPVRQPQQFEQPQPVQQEQQIRPEQLRQPGL